MSSRRLGQGPAIRPANPPNPSRRLVGYKENPESSDAVAKGRDPPRETNDSRSKPTSRIPLNPGVRRPSNPSQPARPGVHRQGQSWGSTGSSSARSGSNGGSSGSSASAREPGLRPGPSLRRKQSNVAQNPESSRDRSRSDSARTGSTSSNPSRSQYSTDRPTDMHYDRSLTESPAEIRVAQAIDIGKPTSPTVKIYPELDRYRGIQRPPGPSDSDSEIPYKLTTHDLPPPTPGYISGTGSQLSTMSGSPSTRFSESPGTGPYSRDTTPTSMSSQSPGLVVPVRFVPPGMQHGSPGRTRPPVTRRRGSSLSNGTDVPNAEPEGLAAKKAQAPPISPPPRKSSARQAHKVRSPEPTTRKLSRRPTHPAVASPPPAMANAGRRMPTKSPRSTPPMRPSRENTPDMHSQLWEPVPVVQSNLSSTSLPGERRGSETHARSTSNSRSTTPSGNPDRARPIHRRQLSGQDKAMARQNDLEKEEATARKGKTEPSRPARTPSPNVSAFNSRFPFFGRKIFPIRPAPPQGCRPMQTGVGVRKYRYPSDSKIIITPRPGLFSRLPLSIPTYSVPVPRWRSQGALAFTPPILSFFPPAFLAFSHPQATPHSLPLPVLDITGSQVSSSSPRPPPNRQGFSASVPFWPASRLEAPKSGRGLPCTS